MTGKVRKFRFLVSMMALFSGFAMAQQSFKMTIYFDSPLFTMTPDGYQSSSYSSKAWFLFRRAYFTYENKLNDNLRFRFRYDADYVKAVDSNGKKDDKLRPFIKHLYLEYTIKQMVWKFGMEDMLLFSDIEEKKWGLRSVYKTIMDGYKDVTGVDIDAYSADVGISIVGSIAKQLRYGFQVTNGAGYSHPEGDDFKKFGARLQFIPVAGLSLVGFVDWERQSDAGDDAYTYKLDAYLEMVKNLTLGAVWFTYDNDLNYVMDGENKIQYNSSGFSIFGTYKVHPDNMTLFARYDYYDPNTEDVEKRQNLVIVGVDWCPIHKTFRLQPNIQFYTYKDAEKKSDVLLALTLFMEF